MLHYVHQLVVNFDCLLYGNGQAEWAYPPDAAGNKINNSGESELKQ